MDLLTSLIETVVLVSVGLVLAWQAKGRFEALEKRMDGFEKRMDGFEKRMDSFQATLDAMRSDLTQVALAVGARSQRAENA